MFHNYYFIKRLADELNGVLCQRVLVSCFSQNKDELILQFVKQEKTQFIRANLEPSISLLSFPSSFERANKNSVDLFDELIGHEVIKVGYFQNERSFFIEFVDDYFLIFKMHARRANILLAKNDEVKHLFRNSLTVDKSITPSKLHKEIKLDKQSFITSPQDPLVLIPTLGKEAYQHLLSLGYQPLDTFKKWEYLNQLLDKLSHNPIFLNDSKVPSISLVEGQKTAANAIEAANWLYLKTVKSFYFDKEKDSAISTLKQKIKRSENYISKTESKLFQQQNSRSPEEIANILMANLHSIQTGLTKVVLTDFYTDQPITIKLNEKLSPQKNAENFYRKSKNRHQEIKILKENIQSKEKLIDTLSRQILLIDEIKSIKELRKLLKEIGLAQTIKENKPELLPYHTYHEDEWVILIGKNAKANDELTLKVANKNDLWLHAKDVAGSHVIVRQRPGQNFPKFIIEKAASLAAKYSKRKNDSLCPVIYTQKKFVRKVKGAPAGQVMVEKEEVVLIEPFND